MTRLRTLRKGDEFDTAYQKGTVHNGPFLVVRWRANGCADARWGFAVGKRIAKSAVVRNRVRRRLKASAQSLAVRPGYDVVVTARARALVTPQAELRAQLKRQLRRAGVLEEREA